MGMVAEVQEGHGLAMDQNLPPRIDKRAGWVIPKDLPKGPNGCALCRWCSKETPSKRRTFCSEACVHEFKLRTNPGYVREQVFERDQGVCAKCRTMTTHGWQADHIIPVAEGGGGCGLDGYRTLCTPCHQVETNALRKRLAAKRKHQDGLFAPEPEGESA